MTLRPNTNGWTAELMEPAGLLVHGRAREEARERSRALVERMAALPAGASATSSSQPLD